MPWDVIGHRWAVSLLQAHLREARIRHAYLFSGPPAIGKTTLTLRFAQALNCQEAPEPGEGCGRCRWCRQAEARAHPDLHIVRRAEDSTRILIDQVRDLQRSLALSPYEARFRVGLLLDFHEATEDAQNALLKTLEEPPARVKLLITARSGDDLLPTVVSRCEHLALRPVASQEIEAALRAGGVTAEAARRIAALAAGLPGRAVELAGDGARLEERHAALADLDLLLRSGLGERFNYVEKLMPWRRISAAEARDRAGRLVEAWLEYLHDVVMAAYAEEFAPRHVDRREEIRRLAREVGGDGFIRAARSAQRSLEAMELYGNVRLALETLMLDLPRVPPRGG